MEEGKMNLSFKIDYQTTWGETLFISGSSPEFGRWDPLLAMPMKNQYPGEWQCETETDAKTIEYKYLLKNSLGDFIQEWGKNRKISLDSIEAEEVRLRDFWRSGSDPENALYSSAFQNVLLKRSPSASNPGKNPAQKTLRLQLHTPVIAPGYKFAVLGAEPAMGSWKETEAILMDDSDAPLWKVDLDASKLTFPLHYKYVICDSRNKRVIEWEAGGNRIIRDFVCKSDRSLKIHTDEKYHQSNGQWKGAGVAVPLFSLRSEHSGGIGEFTDLHLLVDWSLKCGLKLIQLLPLNETVSTHSWVDSYPYKSISVMALHPVFININKIGVLDEETLMVGYLQTLAGFNSQECVHYEEVHKVKSKFFKMIFDQQMESFLKNPAFLEFFEQNKEWLVPYAAFCYLRDKHKTANFRLWNSYPVYNKEEIQKLTSPDNEVFPHIAVHYFIQYHAHKQFSEAVSYARENGVVLKGDIAIGISPNSVEAWTQPSLFNLAQQAGAPPDEFADLGQNWGFPTYNWDVMAKDDYLWWKNRLKQMSRYFDAYRIDHIVGFFRIWEIPASQIFGTMGHFNPALPYSRDEIIDRGINFNEERFTKPYIRDYFLKGLFGEFTDEVKKIYLSEYEPGKFNLKPNFATQKQVWDHFESSRKDKELCGKDSRILDGLCELISEVLFVRDPVRPAHFHPRIAFHDTNSYMNMSDQQRYLLDDLYVEFFYQRHDEFWKAQAMKILPPILKASDMLVCGEDLGMVPGCVPGVMNELGILSLEVQRMPKDPNIEFLRPSDAPYLSVTTTSTHDTSTLRGWWEEDAARSERFFRTIMGNQSAFKKEMEPWLAKDILQQHFWSPAMWTIFPIQDLMAMDEELRRQDFEAERINIPAVAQHYWRYRIHLTLEKLLKAHRFNTELHRMITHSGR
ncbi:MAG TPA: 4-alpha-glucanotransferase [Prolixibacteraceae bacterium]|nr:4-alpha-glucanotransferase [Prolixibacteraceae bacterium]